MISFKQFFLLQENAMGGVPRKIMGVFNNIKDLPQREPYGFWVDKSGNFIPTQSHIGTARKMIEAANEYLKQQGEEPIQMNPVKFLEPYRVLYGDGWIRVLMSNINGDIGYETAPEGYPTRSQMMFLRELKNHYYKSEDVRIVKEREA